MKFNQEYIRLIKNVGLLVILGIIAALIISYFASGEDDTSKIEDTPIHIERVRKIAEISAVSYTDEIVVDSVEYFSDMEEISDWLDAYEITQRIIQRNVKRRLTLIVKGEVKYGFNLASDEFQTQRSGDTLLVVLPKPTLIEVNLTPSGTEVYQEQGTWRDNERKKLEQQAKLKLVQNSSQLDLESKAKETAKRLFARLLKNEDHVEIKFND